MDKKTVKQLEIQIYNYDIQEIKYIANFIEQQENLFILNIHIKLFEQ